MPNSHTDAPAPSDYAAKAQRLVPGRSDLQTMAAILIAERAPEQATVLVVGAGGGVELSAFACMYPQWRFVGIDPSQPMLALTETALGTNGYTKEFVAFETVYSRQQWPVLGLSPAHRSASCAWRTEARAGLCAQSKKPPRRQT